MVVVIQRTHPASLRTTSIPNNHFDVGITTEDLIHRTERSRKNQGVLQRNLTDVRRRTGAPGNETPAAYRLQAIRPFEGFECSTIPETVLADMLYTSPQITRGQFCAPLESAVLYIRDTIGQNDRGNSAIIKCVFFDNRDAFRKGDRRQVGTIGESPITHACYTLLYHYRLNSSGKILTMPMKSIGKVTVMVHLTRS